ncbi:hypothetical protein CXG81DRAFT_8422, partial [Caulochytrium protostelioides]
MLGARSQVGDYLIQDEIGRGSFATVYLGKLKVLVDHEHAASGRPSHAEGGSSDALAGPASSASTLPDPVRGYSLVAIKSVTKEKLNRKLTENLETEIRILKGSAHPHIVELIKIVNSTKYIHLLMEFCAFGDLSAYIKKKGAIAVPSCYRGLPASHPFLAYFADPLAITRLAGPYNGLHETVIRHFLYQLGSSMRFLRKNQLIHRDIKPQNLLLSPSATGRILVPGLPPLPDLKLADFGFARALPHQSLAATLCGSPLYMAPEILRGGRYDASADLWSIGAVLYELVAGRPPFRAQNHIDLLRKIDRGSGEIHFPDAAVVA